MKVIDAACGIFLILFAGWWLLLYLGIATLIDPRLSDREWWGEYLGRILSPGAFIFELFLVLIIAFGFWQVGSLFVRDKPAQSADKQKMS